MSKNENFIDIKHEICVIELRAINIRTKFQANIFVVACAMTKDQVMVMTSFFGNTIFGISNCRTTKQMTFFES